jgi:hypothetical protein
MCVHPRTLLRIELLAAIREAFISAYPNKEVPNETTTHRLVTTFRVNAFLQEGGGHFQHLL